MTEEREGEAICEGPLVVESCDRYIRLPQSCPNRKPYRLLGSHVAISHTTPVASTQGHLLAGFMAIPIKAMTISEAPAHRFRSGVNHF